MIDKQLVLDFVNENGPVLPRDVVKEHGGDTFLVGAVLSQLVDNKQLKLSFSKIGGSPVYYSSGQEEKLQKLYSYLHEKEKKAYDKLKEEKLIRDSQADPVLRVALREIRDFAKPIEVNLRGHKELFWKWYLLANSEAELMIKQILKPTLESLKKEPTTTAVEHKTIEKRQEVQKELMKEPEDHKLLSRVRDIFTQKNVEIIETQVIRKNSEIDFEIYIPSPVGKLKYFCKLRDKKKCNDKDISAAYVQGELRKLPVLFVTTGALTKKASEMLNKEFSKITLMKI